MNILVLDNYDSFTYNLVHILRAMSLPIEVRKNDQITLQEVENFSKILLSPGPGVPSNCGLMPEIINHYAAKKSILGVCLGHQAIGECFGAQLYNLPSVYHGMVTQIEQSADAQLYKDLPSSFSVCRYHSWIVKENELPSDLVVTSRDDKGTIMSLMHREYDVRGVQFHPESIMTEHGAKLIKNWIEI